MKTAEDIRSTYEDEKFTLHMVQTRTAYGNQLLQENLQLKQQYSVHTLAARGAEFPKE